MLKGVYDLYDEDELVLENGYAGDIKEFLGDDKINVSNYAEHGIIYKGRYRIVKADEELARTTFARAWDEAVAPFRRVKWVKHGGRKLGGY